MSGAGTIQGSPAARWRTLFWPGLVGLLIFAVLAGLGTWQLERLQWKQRLLADIARAEAAGPVPLGPAPAPFTKVEATGHFRSDLSALYGAEVRTNASGPVIGAHVITPLERDGAEPVLVDRGWLPQGAPIPSGPDPARIVGYVRAPDRAGWFTASDNPGQRRFFVLDPAAIGAALGLPHVAPFTLVALGPPGGSPAPATALPRPPNDHLGYALTWFGLALCLLGVFVAYARTALRR